MFLTASFLGDYFQILEKQFFFEGKDCNMEQMTRIREQQEQLAKLHFEFGASIESSGSSLSDDSVRQSQSKMNQLIKRLEQLSVSIERLHSTQDKS